MFERPTMALPRVDDDPVIVWTEAERPVRLVYRLARWRVEGDPEPLREVPESLYHPLITHPTERTAGWRCRVRSADSRRTLVLALRRDGALWRAEELPE
ncbi:hypothetical protein MUN76_13645 [Leucobacter rhizosphaerae]|uniref:Nucleotidyltransferase n=1 Tax=Leucobacter rhizosphaerae TaxID=2932245 RepID=A0ABY4FUX8_9MICO|nr:hypothetical protein [Leucobacter rhizosphaerae]UOQ60068.1 hypothetical protein MUN76_13645 [Leucobacter rhizosphaerae]